MVGRPRNFEKEDVLEKAMQVFWRQGYDSTGLTQLEAATGLGRQSIYAVFGDKKGLFMAAVDHYFDTVIQPAFVDLLDAPGSAKRNLLAVIQLWEDAACAPRFSGCLIGNSAIELVARDASVGEVLQRKLGLMRAAMQRAIVRAQDAKELDATLAAEEVASALLALAQGLAVLARVSTDRAMIRSVLRAARRLLGVNDR
jgi:TetR/AcrR family transcriptional regulator, transcriptional repressor for nem operon